MKFRALWIAGLLACCVMIGMGMPPRGPAPAYGACGTSITLTGAGCAPGVAVAYTGEGDIVSGAAIWYGVRAYNAAYATGSNPAADICDAATGLTCTTINILSNGNFDKATASGSPECAVSCVVSKLYDQSGHGLHLTQATNANRPTLTFNAVGGFPCLTFASNQQLGNATGVSQAQPFSFSSYTEKGTSAQTTTTAILYTSGIGAGNLFGGSANPQTLGMYAGGASVGAITASDGSFHAAQMLLNAGGSTVKVDSGSITGVSVGTNNFSTSLTMGSGGTSDTMIVCEAGMWAGSTSSGNQASLASNQASYY